MNFRGTQFSHNRHLRVGREESDIQALEQGAGEEARTEEKWTDMINA